MRFSIVVLSIGLLGVVGSPLYATEVADTVTACEDAAKLLAENDIDAALEEAEWCLEGIQQLKQNLTLAVFPDEVLEFTGGEINNQEALGIKMIERDYVNDSQRIQVSLTGGGAASAGLAALAGLGLNLGAGAKKKIRVQRRTVLDMSEGSSVQYMVKLKSGSMLTISSSNVDADATLEFVKAFPLAELDDALGE
ncbi:MAG: hypothetical protein KTR32_27635 [Granulosicoccus sp.]|nr:hypothetical protein [Granulosicoccus sp.]